MEAQVFGWAGFVVKSKLQILKSKLKEWNYEVFGNVDSKIKVAEIELHALDLEAGVRGLNDQEVSKRRNLLGEVWKLRKIREWVWLQKSRLNWALKGDKNTRFFHVMTKSRQGKNMLDCIQGNGRNVMQPNKVKRVVRHFQCLFSEDWEHRPKIVGTLKSLNSNTAADLEVEFSKAEVWAAIKSCDGNKAPSPDGFNLSCIQKC